MVSSILNRVEKKKNDVDYQDCKNMPILDDNSEENIFEDDDMVWNNQTYDNWSVKMENAAKGLILASNKEVEQYNKNNPLPSEDEVNKILKSLM